MIRVVSMLTVKIKSTSIAVCATLAGPVNTVTKVTIIQIYIITLYV